MLPDYPPPPHNQNIQKLSSLDFSSCQAGANLLFGSVLLPTSTSSLQADKGLRLLWKSFKPFPVCYFFFFFFSFINDNFFVRRSAFQQWRTPLLQQLVSGHLGGTEGHRSCPADPTGPVEGGPGPVDPGPVDPGPVGSGPVNPGPVEGGPGVPAGAGQHVRHLLLLVVVVQHGELGA